MACFILASTSVPLFGFGDFGLGLELDIFMTILRHGQQEVAMAAPHPLVAGTAPGQQFLRTGYFLLRKYY